MKKLLFTILGVAIIIIIVIFVQKCIIKKDSDLIQLTDITYIVKENMLSDISIKILKIEDENYLFLPSSADLNKIKLQYPGKNITLKLEKNENTINVKSGKEFDFLKFYNQKPDNGIYDVYITIKCLGNSSETYKLNIMKSENIDSVYISSSDPETKGRKYIESDTNHELTAEGKIALLSKDNNVIYDGKLKEIKGRGNSSWKKYEKKSYQIKLDEKADLICDQISDNSSKKWVLISNVMDYTLLHNQITYNLGKELGIENTPDCKQTDLYYDGEYRGTYLLVEKVDISENILDIYDLESDFEGKNAGVDFDSLITNQKTNKYGDEYQYVEMLKNPENYTGGYLIEIDNHYYNKEKSWFKTGTNNYYVVKSPKYMSKRTMEYISSIFSEIEVCINNNGINPQTGKKISDYIDVDSFSKFIMINEWSENDDGFVSSTYVYKNKDDDKIYAGPIWDFDIAYENQIESALSNTEGFLYLTDLENLDIISNKMKEFYDNELYEKVKKILLSEENEEGNYLKSLSEYVDNISASVKMNYKLWKFRKNNDVGQTMTYNDYILALKNFLSIRTEWLKNNWM